MIPYFLKNMSECVVKILSIDDNTDQVFWSKVIQVSTGEDEPQAIVEKKNRIW